MRITPAVFAELLPSVASGSLILTGIGDPDGGRGDIVELYGTAAVPDLSIYGILPPNADGLDPEKLFASCSGLNDLAATFALLATFYPHWA